MRKTLGDIDVVYHDGIYHLFHLVLPNHDFIAHAVSDNGFTWRRVENALFIGHPGSWDDSMLWTMHVTRHPRRPGVWRMFYTGLSRRDHGAKQRIGLAESEDLFCWTKSPVWWKDRRSPLPYDLPGQPPQPPFAHDPESNFPLEPDGEYYECDVDEGRHWVSFRDPFYFHDGDQGWLLAAARVNHGPVVRRGCVSVMQETSLNQFQAKRPLYHPGLYDDIEVPNLFKIDGEFYLVGSMREDAKIRYWHTDRIGNPWKSYADNVLLATGNYAGRVCHDDRGILLWSFFTPPGLDRLSNNLMPPPKRVFRESNGRLSLRTYEGFESRIRSCADTSHLQSINSGDSCECKMKSETACELTSESGFQAFVFDDDVESFRLRAKLCMIDSGKCGLVFRLDRETRDGYYLSLDLFKGVAQLRAWGSGPDGSGEDMMQFMSLQSGYWVCENRGTAMLQLLVYGSYIELSVNDRILLSLADQSYDKGAIGFYLESAELDVSNIQLDHFDSPVQDDAHLANG